MEKESSDANEKGKLIDKNIFHVKKKKLKAERNK
jgi:hypothetical protein